ncbi:hypothetical protein CIHG_07616 [Coccidioides immitis H538.4]|uniref:Uncharacterized protein n=1 Tax=Coccidioides immitis H538.4 TaxID=396776 RepID=A0A0J8UQS5_COCIT|nr:hypothetical protein CIHG_07616 [Coccidioides immitis H538.4]
MSLEDTTSQVKQPPKNGQGNPAPYPFAFMLTSTIIKSGESLTQGLEPDTGNSMSGRGEMSIGNDDSIRGTFYDMYGMSTLRESGTRLTTYLGL